jgi:hypothetical protein
LRTKIVGSPLTPGGQAQSYTWQQGQYAGLKRYPGAGKGQTYRTFRTVSDTSDPNSWWLPPIPPNDIVGAVRRTVEPNIQSIIAEALR